MTDILEILPDNKGGQLKFKVDKINCTWLSGEVIINPGDSVDIFVYEEKIFGMLKSSNLHNINQVVLMCGRPKGYGVICWNEGQDSYVLWSAYIGDEGHFPK
jgi:hypothetical protein